MNHEDTELKTAKARIETGEMLHQYALRLHELHLRKSWDKGVEEYFIDHPRISEFSWRQFSQKDGRFYCNPSDVRINDAIAPPNDLSYKDAVEFLFFYTAQELRQLFGNFVEVTIRRDKLVHLKLVEEPIVGCETIF